MESENISIVLAQGIIDCAMVESVGHSYCIHCYAEYTPPTWKAEHEPHCVIHLAEAVLDMAGDND